MFGDIVNAGQLRVTEIGLEGHRISQHTSQMEIMGGMTNNVQVRLAVHRT
jgi:hypothetical protein